MPLASSLSSLRRVPASCQRARIFVFLEGLGLQLSASATGGDSALRGRGPGGLRLKAPPLPAGKAQQFSARAAGHPSSASSLESRRGGEQVFAASSITAKKRPRFLQTPPLLATDCPPLRGFCASRQRWLRGPPVPLAADATPLRALTTWPPSTWA